jgi:hypothetical protein
LKPDFKLNSISEQQQEVLFRILDRYFNIPGFEVSILKKLGLNLSVEDLRDIENLYSIYREYEYKWQLALSAWRLDDKLDEMKDTISDLQAEVIALKKRVNRIDHQVNDKEY